jgi:hypothetical protein
VASGPTRSRPRSCCGSRRCSPAPRELRWPREGRAGDLRFHLHVST